MVMLLSQADHETVTAAVTEAERATDGEIVTVVAAQSDAYHDVALHWSLLAMLLVPALLALTPGTAADLWLIVDPWSLGVPAAAPYLVVLLLSALVFLLVRLITRPMAVRMALTPGSTKTRRVHRRALALFRVGAEHRTRAATGVLLYLSLAEHRAEIVADAAIHSRVAPDLWGEAMAALIAATREGRPADGMAEAVRLIGAVLAEHFPGSHDDENELPDRLIEL